MSVLLNYGVHEEERKKKLEELDIHDLRKIGRAVGVKSPTTQQKSDLINSILDVEYGRTPPTNSRRGRHPKAQEPLATETAEAADGKRPAVSRTVRGVVTLLPNGEGVLTAEWTTQDKGPVSFTPAENVKIPAGVALEAGLRMGDVIVGVARTDESEAVSLYSVGSINGTPSEEAKNRERIQAAFGGYPTQKFYLSGTEPKLRVWDLFSPLGRGSRALAVTPSESETEKLLHSAVKNICMQCKNVFVIFNEDYPEDAAEFCEGLSVTPVLLEYGKPAEKRICAIRLVLEHCKRLAEGGEDAVLVIPSLTKLVLTATEAASPALPTALNFGLAKEIFGSACTLTGGGSLTVLTGAVLSAMDDVASAAYHELSRAVNMQYALTKENGKLCVDFTRTYTKKVEKLLSAYEFTLMENLKERALNGDITFMDALLNAATYEEAITNLSEG
ncbi:MAG: hypothetical protein E7363_03475 [Clostridiales bacterium]|nr:hypothetical protein [Clostridiales bacterium]